MINCTLPIILCHATYCTCAYVWIFYLFHLLKTKMERLISIDCQIFHTMYLHRSIYTVAINEMR